MSAHGGIFVPDKSPVPKSIKAMRYKADLVHRWVTSVRCEASQREEVEAWMPTG